MNGENYQKPYRTTTQKEFRGTRKCWVDYYKKRWVAVELENGEEIWVRIDWRNERYYISVVEEVDNQLKFTIQNREIKQYDQPEDQQLKDKEIKSDCGTSFNKFRMRIPGKDRDSELQVTKRENKVVQVKVANMIEIERSNSLKVSMEEMIVKNAVQAYMRREQGEYGGMKIIMKIKKETQRVTKI
jgi:small nuclear ribonucleoprotein (snRNP)-like protein